MSQQHAGTTNYKVYIRVIARSGAFWALADICRYPRESNKIFLNIPDFRNLALIRNIWPDIGEIQENISN